MPCPYPYLAACMDLDVPLASLSPCPYPYLAACMDLDVPLAS
eukprot:gene9388-24160_t